MAMNYLFFLRGNTGVPKEMLDCLWSYVRTDDADIDDLSVSLGSCQRTSLVFEKRPSSPSAPFPSFSMRMGRFYLSGSTSEERPPSGFSLSLGTQKQRGERLEPVPAKLPGSLPHTCFAKKVDILSRADPVGALSHRRPNWPRRGTALLFNKDTFEVVSSLKHLVVPWSCGTIEHQKYRWAIDCVMATARIRRPSSKKGVSVSLLLVLRHIIVKDNVQIFAGDVNHGARRPPNVAPRSSMDLARGNTNLPKPNGTTPIWGPEENSTRTAGTTLSASVSRRKCPDLCSRQSKI